MYEADVADIAALKALIANALPGHARIRVLTLLQEFWLDKESNADSDGITVVTARFSRPRATPGGVVANLGQGRWLRNPLPVPEWTAKKNWYQDSVAGNDEKSGDSTSPVKTMAEITRRLRRVDSALYTIHQQEAVAGTDSVRFTPEISDKGAEFFPDTQTVAKILIKGKRGTVPPAVLPMIPPTVPPVPPTVFTATTETDPKGNTQATVTATSVDWSKHIGQILEVTKGKAKGAQAVVLKDLTAGKARVSEWTVPATGVLAPVPVASDEYEILLLPAFSAPISYAGLPCCVELGFQGVTISKPPAPFPEGVLPAAYTTTFTSCRFEVPLPGPPAAFPFVCVLIACSVFFDVLAPNKNFCQTAFGEGPRFLGCGLVNARIQVSSFGRTTIRDTVIQSGAIRGIDVDKGRIFGGLIVVAGKLGIFDSPAAESAITLRRGMAMQIQKGAKLYGSGNAVRGVEVSEGASLAVQADVTPTITGKDGEVQIEGATTAIPELVPGNVPKAVALSTWDDWSNPTKAFRRNVVNYKTGSRIISTA